MRVLVATALAIFLINVAGTHVSAQTGVPAPLQLPSAGPASGGGQRPDPHRVGGANRFRLFRNEADFRRHAPPIAATACSPPNSGWRAPATAAAGRATWSDNLCVDQTGRLPETCLRDGEKENYLSARRSPDHRQGWGAVPPGALCAWTFDDGEAAPGQATTRCDEEVRIRVRYGRTTIAAVDVALPDGTAQRAIAEIAVRDFLIAGMGDFDRRRRRQSRPADRARRWRLLLPPFLLPARPANISGPAAPASRAAGPAIQACRVERQHLGRLVAAQCALVERGLPPLALRLSDARRARDRGREPASAVTFLPLACSGATIDLGFFNPLRARECPPTGACAANAVPQMVRLKEALDLARKTDKERKLDAILLTIGANDIWFAGLVANVIIDASAPSARCSKRAA